MTAPTLVPFHRAAAAVRALSLPARDQQLFVIAESGVFGGRNWRKGDVVAATHAGDGVAVIAPRGHGRLRLGTVRGARVFGETGEPCLAARWEVRGRLCTVFHASGSEWVEEPLDEPTDLPWERAA